MSKDTFTHSIGWIGQRMRTVKRDGNEEEAGPTVNKRRAAEEETTTNTVGGAPAASIRLYTHTHKHCWAVCRERDRICARV